MLHIRDFEIFSQLLLLDLVSAVHEFSKSSCNHRIYALALFVSFGGDEPFLCINGESFAAQHDPSIECGVDQDRFDAWQFQYKDLEYLSEDTKQFLEKWRRYADGLHDITRRELDSDSDVSLEAIDHANDEIYRLDNQYFESLYKVLNTLSSSCDCLDRTDEFVLYVYLGNNDTITRTREGLHK